MTIDMSQYRDAFVREVKNSLDNGRTALRQLVTTPPDPTALERVTRFFHTLGGTAALMGFPTVSDRCRTLETQFRGMGEAKKLPNLDQVQELLIEVDRFEPTLLAYDEPVKEPKEA